MISGPDIDDLIPSTDPASRRYRRIDNGLTICDACGWDVERTEQRGGDTLCLRCAGEWDEENDTSGE